MHRKKPKSLLAWLMILAMLCTMLPTAALATEGSSGAAAGVEATVTGATYSVTVDSAITGGTVAVEPASGTEGTVIKVTATPDSGKRLVANSLQYTADSGANYTEINAADGVYSFVLPAANVIVTAQFSELPAEGKTPPDLTADTTNNTVGQAMYLTFTDDEVWRNAVSSVSVDSSAVDSSKYTIEAGSIAIDQSVFTTAKDYTIVISATGYSDASVIQTINAASTTVWDGSVDVTWYNTTDTVFYLSTPAQLAGLAAIVNGIYNEGATVIGDPSYIVPNVGLTAGSGSTELDWTKDTWIYGNDNFAGKTVYLTADLDMGGVYDSGTDTWSGPNYMPVGGQYCMTVGDGCTLLSSSWNGTFDGQGHTVKNIYCSRHEFGYAFSQSIGLIGRMGVHDDDPHDWWASPSIKNVAVTGYIYGNRSIGGIVGKNGKSTASLIENCLNYATVQNTDSKGVGGIAGAGWNRLTIKNCANFGFIYTSIATPAASPATMKPMFTTATTSAT